MKKIIVASSVLLMSLWGSAQVSESSYEARSNVRVGKMRVSDFQAANARGAEMVNAIMPNNKPLSAADQQLFNQVALGGMRQLQVSQAVLAKATDEQVRLLAQSEVEEQTNVSAKLKEMASAKGASMPSQPDAETIALVNQIQGLSPAEVNQLYIRESGIRGHELLRSTMNTVRSTANDENMKALAKATLPVIKTHLKVSKQVESKMR